MQSIGHLMHLISPVHAHSHLTFSNSPLIPTDLSLLSNMPTVPLTSIISSEEAGTSGEPAPAATTAAVTSRHTHLPADILICIFSFADMHTLKNAVLCNAEVFSLAAPFLYVDLGIEYFCDIQTFLAPVRAIASR